MSCSSRTAASELWALALILVLLLKISLLVDLGVLAPIGLILGQSLSRALPVIQLGFQPYARVDDPKSRSRDVARSGGVQACVAAIWVAALLAFGHTLGAPTSALAGSVAAMALVGVAFGLYVQRRAGGLTGDFMGAIQQLAELGILFSLASAL